MERLNPKWVLKRRPAGEASTEDLELVESLAPELREGDLLVRNLYLSLDPTNRLWMNEREQYLPPAEGGWQLYTVSPAKRTRRLKKLPGLPAAPPIPAPRRRSSA
jgi:NADPH-dependent curcumin reductase CurA